MKDDLGLGKLEKDLNKSLNFRIFPKEKKQNRNPSKKQSKKEKKFFNGGTRRTKTDYSQEIKTVKAIGKESKKGFSNLISAIKNRKIRKLEKKAMKAKEKADKLAHEIKTQQALEDSLTDIARYEQQLEKMKQENKEREAQLKDKENRKVAENEE